MSRGTSSKQEHARPATVYAQRPSRHQPAFRLSPLAAVLASLSLFSTGPLYAADDATVKDLQAEVARLKGEKSAAAGIQLISLPHYPLAVLSRAVIQLSSFQL